MVNSREVYLSIKSQLAKAGIPDAGFESSLLLEHFAGVTRFDEKLLDAEILEQLETMVKRRLGREPLQYILGKWPFLDMELMVGPGVLIPRQETEEVCLKAVEILLGFDTDAPDVVDLCSGSGAIALGIQSKIANANVTAVELSDEAFLYLEKNTLEFAKTNPKTPVCVKQDVFKYFKTLSPGSLDMVISNPPYVTEQEYKTMEKELYHEPEMALVATENGLEFYIKISGLYKQALKDGGVLVYEIGSGQAKDVLDILDNAGYKNPCIQKDLQGNDRIALAYK